ncbi:MAG: phosphoribosyltransferase [Candidatus Levybacteria bacterium]|nr:phosphoribosyltransferase [Candidatus Levybacteria bacterium]
MFADRQEAGNLLGDKVKKELGIDEGVVLGITRGGVIVAQRVADKLGFPLDIIVIKKIGAPGNPELAIGAVGPQETIFWDERFTGETGVDEQYKTACVKEKKSELAAQESKLRSGKLPISLAEKDVCLVDDGVATGTTVLCAREYLIKKKAKRIILAVPVIAEDTMKQFAKQFDRIITLRVEKNFAAVGQFYRDFPQVTDEEVIDLINKMNLSEKVKTKS